MIKYKGSCHCGNVSFQFEQEEITAGLRCNCSICIRKGAAMTNFVIPPDKLQYQVKEPDTLALYEFDNKVAKHYFCKICGIFTFNQTLRMPEHYRVNLGCLENLDLESITDIGVFDGKKL